MTAKFRLALQWRDDVESAEMIESDSYCRTHLSYDIVGQRELDAICCAANEFYKSMGSPLRIQNHMGELIPTTKH